MISTRFVFAIAIVWLVLADDIRSERVFEECATKTKCGDCVQTANCSWCLQDDYEPPRCDGEQSWTSCSDVYRVRSNHTIIAPSGGFSIISPRQILVNLRINEEHRVQLVYNQPENYPLDLYYLMDLSYSMFDDKTKLSTLGSELHKRISRITADFQLGFGSFVDKKLMPYVSMDPNSLRSPCDGCIGAYGFRNHLSLTRDSKTFSRMVRDSQISGNLDNPEGGFDGIVQAIVCDRAIGWRNASRRLILFATDAGFHTAGDGKLGGIIEPNDGRCHLDANGEYTESTHQDYPSVSQINMLAKKHSVNIIFAVTKDNKMVYTRLSERIEGSSSAVLSDDSSNIVQVVQDEYNKIRSTVEMKDNAPSFIHVDYYSNCNTAIRTKTNKCQNLQNGERVSFEVVFTATECPQLKDDWTQLVRIYPVGFRNQSTLVEIRLLCDCDCERQISVLSSKCDGKGYRKCGLCECIDGYVGKNCECSIKSMHDEPRPDTNPCLRANETIECSGRGTCFCGECKCNERPNRNEKFSGPFCECDNFSCEQRDGRLCSGNGVCKCGNCVCGPRYIGSACDCSQAQDNCLVDGTICSGHGECVCNECACDQTADHPYSGAVCQHCPSCPGRCNDIKDCVLCHMYEKGPLAESAELCEQRCDHIKFTAVTDFDGVEMARETPCVYYEDGCTFQFVYRSIESISDKIEVIAQEAMDCPNAFDALIIVLSVIAAIVLAGLAMLLGWKLLTTFHDRREFLRFQTECSTPKWEQGHNPLFKTPTTTFKNPMFDRKSVPPLAKEGILKTNTKID